MLQQATERNPRHSPSWQAWGMLEAETGNIQKARQVSYAIIVLLVLQVTLCFRVHDASSDQPECRLQVSLSACLSCVSFHQLQRMSVAEGHTGITFHITLHHHRSSSKECGRVQKGPILSVSCRAGQSWRQRKDVTMTHASISGLLWKHSRTLCLCW